MPSMDTYRKLVGTNRSNIARMNDSFTITNATWWDDIASKTGYLYDWYHDDEPLELEDLHPEKSLVKTPIDVKHFTHTSQTMDKDAVTMHIQLRPHQDCNVKYYEEFFKDRYDATFPIGLYIDLPDAEGKYNRWLVCAKANYHDVLYPTFEVLPCDYLVQYVFDGKCYQVPAVLRSQSSYNSGIWADYKITSVEDQQKFIVPLNRDTENIYYNQRMLIDAAVLSEPRAWQVTKTNRINNPGINLVTLAQTQFNKHTDAVLVDDNGNVIGMYADYYSSTVQPEEFDQTTPTVPDTEIYSKISYSGLKPELKSGGSYKKFTVDFYDINNESIEFQSGEWKFAIRSDQSQEWEDATDLVGTLTHNDSTDVDENQIKVKFIGGDMYISDQLRISYVTDYGVESNVEIEILGL